jgi:hypothetical protein
VSALLISGKTRATEIPSLYPNLIFLSLRLEAGGDSLDLHLNFAELTGLVIYIDQEEAFQVFKMWNMPKLQHLHITFGNEGPFDPLDGLFERDRPSLLSLALRGYGISRPPPDIWSRVPNL